MERFTEEDLAIAKQVDLTAVASSLGYTVKRIGKYHTLKEMDSIRIYDKTHWFRWSRQYETGANGGSQIDFLRVFCGMEIKEAVFWLLDFAGYQKESSKAFVMIEEADKKKEKKVFRLPEPAPDHSHLYWYLNEKRGIRKDVIDFFVKADLIYEEKKYHNIVFKGKDAEGMTRFASMRGVFDKEGKSFQCDVAGNDKAYGFHMANEESKELVVFEAAIDLMSYVDIHGDFESNKLALGMVHDAPLKTFLREYPVVENIRFCLDNDVPGRKATEQLMEKYYGLGYDVEDCPPPAGYKDYNEWLMRTVQELKAKEKKQIGKEGETL